MQIQNIFSLLVVHDQIREVYVTREHKYHKIIKVKGEDNCFMPLSNPVRVRFLVLRIADTIETNNCTFHLTIISLQSLKHVFPCCKYEKSNGFVVQNALNYRL